MFPAPFDHVPPSARAGGSRVGPISVLPVAAQNEPCYSRQSLEPGGRGRCPGSPAAFPRHGGGYLTKPMQKSQHPEPLVECRHGCVTQLPSPGPPPLPKEPPRPQPSPAAWMHGAEVQTRRGCGCPGATRVSPFHPLARTPQQAKPTALPLPAASHGAAAGNLLPPGSACTALPKTVPWESPGWPAVSVPGPNSMSRRPPSRWAALKLVGNFVNRQFPPPSTILAWRPALLPHRPPRAQLSELAFRLRVFPPAICSRYEAGLRKEATRFD